MTEEINIQTPDGGKQIWILHVTKDDDILGTIKFTDEKSLNEFKKAYSVLPEESWGLIIVGFDTEKN